ncbi:succinate-semialdehyde dehydrogenase/glutarate-semialdehyde dehydrogenase [Novosphingobium hassiacum]|uniref:Succinate-semialdehyde dehydrogenase/glutarate-semialdehyde dehydrogenase n=1 Tax=Novosphingobium hassiacum TaxID=173676 RepID=A0A7W5ZX07_9SPHN|nr:NAD-dependent succinate-semialdehyde dehydrogenase [Novosphingobium hassiacum]MBB3859380.1 succinate-semialdehyde dehydrogenase/glutarate-semialdehyde dehydrogenase [Novosphingobium hassiacum]
MTADSALGLLRPHTLDSDDGIRVLNPANGVLVASARRYDVDETAAMIEAADVARREWGARTAKQRSDVLRAWYDLMVAHAEDLALLMTLESGKPLDEARGEVKYGASFIEWFSEEARRAYGEVIPSYATDKRVLTLRQPVGTCAAITPWNFPLAMITRKVAPALAAGCSIIVKPAEATPLSALALETLAHRAGVPEDLFRVAPARKSSAIGELFCTHPLVRKISFTGSTEVGKVIMAKAAGQVKRLSLELGGNAPFIVFDDADLDRAIAGAMASRFRNAGQTCVCANRFLVQAGVYEAFVEKLVAAVAQVRVEDGVANPSGMGPLIDDRAVERVAGLVTQALAQGAMRAGENVAAPAGGAFHPPVVLAEVTEAMAIAGEEIFGPVAPVLRFKDESEALRIANDTPYGLAAYVFTADAARQWRMMEGLEYGMVGVNDGLISTEVAPFGGIKESGFGREGSSHGLADYMNVKYCLVGGL